MNRILQQNTQLSERTVMAVLYYLQSESVLTHFAPSSSRSRSASSRHSLISRSSSFQSKDLLLTCVEEFCGCIFFCRIALRSCRHDRMRCKPKKTKHTLTTTNLQKNLTVPSPFLTAAKSFLALEPWEGNHPCTRTI
jgi:hypothetical protein